MEQRTQEPSNVFHLRLPVNDRIPFEVVEQYARTLCDENGAHGPLTYHGKRSFDLDPDSFFHDFSAPRKGAPGE